MRTRVVLLTACTTFVCLTVVAASSRSDPPTTYGSTSTIATIADFGAGFGLLAAGAIAAVFHRLGSVAVGTASLGVVWSASDWVGWASGPPLARSVAMLLPPLAVPLVIGLALSNNFGRVEDRLARSLVALAFAGAIVVSVGRAIFRNPFLDLYCWSNCDDNVFLVRSDIGVARALDRGWLLVSAVLGVVAAALAVSRLGRATRVARRSTWFIVVPASAAAIVFSAGAVLLWRVPVEDPARPLFRLDYFAQASAFIALAIGVIRGVWRTRHTQHAVMHLADKLGINPAPGSLRQTLADTLGDEALVVAYWLPSRQRFVDASGQTVDPMPAKGQTTTAIVREGEEVALVLHDASLTPQTQIGAAARLAVDNERLRAEVLAQLGDLRESRTRIVATADTTRRRIERNLHDGAQQRLLAASFELRLALTAASADNDRDLTEVVASASQEAQLALEELRDLAHGIFPAILTDGGLEPAVRRLRDKAAIPVEVGELCSARYVDRIETAAYLVVEAAIHEATRCSATYLCLDIAQRDGNLVVDARCHGGDAVLEVEIGLVDRIGALGGRLVASDRMVVAEIPCES